MAPAQAAAHFHDQLARGLAGVAATAAAQTGITTVALTGGCLANGRLSDTLTDLLQRHGLRVLRHAKSPPGDGGLALGQVWAAALIEGE
jgi:hydrogenase maturation protein HypF